ncbi:hypothetical protein Hanom_Chr14g01284891 [Helianthus anomalus]
MKQQLATKVPHQWSKLKTHTSTLPFPLRLNHASSWPISSIVFFFFSPFFSTTLT